MERAYQTDLSDEEWTFVEPHLPAPEAPGRPRIHALREEILNAGFYIVRSGCAWRLVPKEYPPWKTVHHYFRKLPRKFPVSAMALAPLALLVASGLLAFRIIRRT